MEKYKNYYGKEGFGLRCKGLEKILVTLCGASEIKLESNDLKCELERKYLA